jgi:hypothetical protein
LRTLVVAADADDVVDGTASDQEVFALPLTPEATWAVVKGGLPNALPRWGRSYNRQLALNDAAEGLVSGILQKGLPHERASDDYELAVLASNIVIWREQIRAVAGTADFTSIAIPALSCRKPQSSSSHSNPYDHLLRLVLAEELKALGQGSNLSSPTYDQRLEGPGLPMLGNSHIGLTTSLRRSVRRAVRAARRHITGIRRRARLFGRDAEVRVLVIAQPSKVSKLRAVRDARIDIVFLDYQDLHSLFVGGGERSFACDSCESVDAFLRDLAIARARERIARVDVIESLARGAWDVLITDAQHDVAVGQLVEASLEVGKRVAVIPEGCISYTGRLTPFAHGLFLRDARLTRFALDQRQRDFWERQDLAQKEVLVSGYLGDTNLPMTQRSRLTAAKLNRRLRQLGRPADTPVAFLTFDTFLTNSEAGRFGQSSLSEALLDLLAIVNALVDHGVIVIARARDHRLADELGQAFVGKSALFTSRIPWQLLARRADVVLTRDSSIGWEATQLGLKVLLWNFSDYPGFAEEALSGPRFDQTTVARDISQLVDAVLAAPHTKPGSPRANHQRDRPDWNEGIGHVVEWIRSGDR